MKITLLASGIGLALGAIACNAGTAPSTGMVECRDEAIATGLEEETAIQSYIDQCIQRFAGMEDYLYNITGTDNPEDSAQEQPEDAIAEHEPIN